MALTVFLEAVIDNENQSKSDRDPAEWMPSMAGTACDYGADWVFGKYCWQLRIDPAEHAALSSTMSPYTDITPATQSYKKLPGLPQGHPNWMD